MYEPYQYNPYTPNVASIPAMQNRLAQLQGNNNYYRPQILKGRPVGCIDEVRGSQIDLDGTVTYFPSPSENKIYTKYVDMNGCSVVNCYKLEIPQRNVEIPADSLKQTYENLEERITKIEKFVKELTGDESNGNNATNATGTKPSNVHATNGNEQPYLG